jgi:hypothetical protein
MDPFALEELEGGSIDRRAREGEKALPPTTRHPSTAAASTLQREGEGISKRVEEDGEKRERERLRWQIRDAGRRHWRLIIL